jgi:hypothetical protein
MDSNKLPLEPHHQGVSSGASKTISEPIVHSVQTVPLYCTDTNIVSKRTKTRFHMTQSPWISIVCVQHDFRPDGTFNTNCAPFFRQDYHYLQTDSNKLPLDPRLLEVSSGVSKMIFEAIVHWAQTVHLYCTDPNTVSKRTETRFHTTYSPRSSITCVQHGI